jgi:hypothetical protein
LMGEWYFEKRDPRGVQSEPKNDEHFANVSGVVASLVRETTQNSGDAWAEGKAVRMEFRFGKIERVRFQKYIEGLQPHVEAFPALAGHMSDTGPVKFLAIEDFETVGLQGAYDPSPHSDSNYVKFWHRYGDSGKEGQAGGRHGLGKSTIASASRVRLFFGATVPKDNPHLLLQAQISLKHHSILGEPGIFDAYGLWYDKVADTYLPFVDGRAEEFLHDFGLSRQRTPGLSLVIPFYDSDEITEESLVRALIESSFHQIVNGELVVSVGDVQINKATIKALVADYGMLHLSRAIELSHESTSPDLKRFVADHRLVGERLSTNHFGEQDLSVMRSLWAAGEAIAVTLPIVTRKKRSSEKEEGQVELYIRREQDAALAKETYVRGRVTVPIRQMGEGAVCVALLLASSGTASTFLGDSEPPAHNQWLLNRLKHYAKPEETLNRIKYALRDLFGIVAEVEDNKPLKDAFTEYLWVERPEDEDQEDERPPVPGPRPVPDPIPSEPKPHVLRRIEGGFAYSYSAAEPADSARIVASYRRRARSKRHANEKFGDFDEPMATAEVGSATMAQEVAPRQIVISLAEVQPGYELEVTGFDPNRDIELHLEAR